jgi:hypothetical protein
MQHDFHTIEISQELYVESYIQLHSIDPTAGLKHIPLPTSNDYYSTTLGDSASPPYGYSRISSFPYLQIVPVYIFL